MEVYLLKVFHFSKILWDLHIRCEDSGAYLAVDNLVSQVVFPIVDVRLNVSCVVDRGSYPHPTTFQMPAPPDLPHAHADRCKKGVLIESIFFAWCSLISQIILTTRCEVCP